MFGHIIDTLWNKKSELRYKMKILKWSKITNNAKGNWKLCLLDEVPQAVRNYSPPGALLFQLFCCETHKSHCICVRFSKCIHTCEKHSANPFLLLKSVNAAWILIFFRLWIWFGTISSTQCCSGHQWRRWISPIPWCTPGSPSATYSPCRATFHTLDALAMTTNPLLISTTNLKSNTRCMPLVMALVRVTPSTLPVMICPPQRDSSSTTART